MVGDRGSPPRWLGAVRRSLPPTTYHLSPRQKNPRVGVGPPGGERRRLRFWFPRRHWDCKAAANSSKQLTLCNQYLDAARWRHMTVVVMSRHRVLRVLALVSSARQERAGVHCELAKGGRSAGFTADVCTRANRALLNRTVDSRVSVGEPGAACCRGFG